MEKAKDWEQETLINELNQGIELTKQLKNHIDPLLSTESCEFVIQKILSSYEKVLSLLNWGGLEGELHQMDSPRSEAYDRDLKDQCHREVYKKRKTLPRWTEQVSVCLGTGAGHPDDGYSWRKYGQKDILGAKFPRSYYRCTHRNAQGCLATKQVQRSDEDPSIFEISYRGRHTCIHTSRIIPGLSSIQKEGPKVPNNAQPHQKEENQNQSQETLFDLGKGLEVKTEELGIMEELFPSFPFPSTPNEHENVKTTTFPESLKEKNFLASDTPAFASTETSESNFFSLLPCLMEMDNFGLSQNLGLSESSFAEIVSAPTLVSNSHIADLDFSLNQENFFDPKFTFDSSEFFSSLE